MALPGFYNQGDQDIYTGGEHFIPQEQYRLDYPNTPPPSIANPAATGIVNTQAASPYIWPPQGGGGDFKGAGKYGHLDMSKTKDFVKNVYVDQGPKKGWQKQTVTGYYDTQTGNWKTKDNKNIQHAGLEVPGLFTSLMNKVSGKQFGVPRVGDIQGTFTKDPSGDIEEEEAIAKAAIHRNRVNNIIRTGIYKDDYITRGPRGDGVPDDGTTGGVITRGTFEGDHPDRPTKTPEQGGWHPGVGGADSGSAQTVDTSSANNVPPSMRAQGGRIGLRPGGIVDAGKQYYGKEDWEIQQINKYGVSYPEFLQNQFGKGLHEMDASEIATAVKAWDSWRSSQAEGGRIGYREGEFVDENIEGPGFDENLMAGFIDPQDALNDMSMNIYGKPLHELTPEEYQMLIDMANDQAMGDQDQGIASLV